MKGFKKLSIQISVLSSSMIALSFLTDTQIWIDYFNNEIFIPDGDGCYHGFRNQRFKTLHHHWNYRGYVYFYTGAAYFILSVAKIITSHKESDFKES